MPTTTVASATTVGPGPSNPPRDTTTSSSSVSSRLSMLSRIQQRPHHRYKQVGEYTLGPTIGQGEFGKVKLAWSEGENGVKRQFAFKLLREDKMRGIDQSQKMKVQHEIYALQCCRHPNIIRLERVVRFEKYIAIILDYASGGDMFTYIFNNGKLEERMAQRLFAQLVSGVHYMHQKGISHRDLKLENLLLDSNNNIQISDFGFANRFRGSGGITLMKTACGSPCYAAPEVVNSHKNYDGRKADVWSVGVILFTFLAGYLPFDDDPTNPDSDDVQKLYRYIANTPLKFPDWIGVEARDLLRRILVVDPEKRIKIQDIMSHRWLADHYAFLSITHAEHEGSAPWQRSSTTRASSSAGADGSTVSVSSSTSSILPANTTPPAIASPPANVSRASSNAGHYRQQQAPRNVSIQQAQHQQAQHQQAPHQQAQHQQIQRPYQYQHPHPHPHASARSASTSAATAAAAAAMPASLSPGPVARKQQQPPLRQYTIPKDIKDQRRQSAHPAVTTRPKQSDDVRDLSISDNKHHQRLHQTVKPRPASFQQVQTNSLALGGGENLYGLGSSQPRVALNRESSKSGEMSRPQVFHDAREVPTYGFSQTRTNLTSDHRRTQSTQIPQLYPHQEQAAPVQMQQQQQQQQQQPTIQLVSDTRRHSVMHVSNIPRSSSAFDTSIRHPPPPVSSGIPPELSAESPEKKEMVPPVRRASVRAGQSQQAHEEASNASIRRASARSSVVAPPPSIPVSQSTHSIFKADHSDASQSDIPQNRSSISRIRNSFWTRNKSSGGDQPQVDNRRASYASVAPSVAPSVATSSTQERPSGIPRKQTNFREKTLNFFKRRSLVG